MSPCQDWMADRSRPTLSAALTTRQKSPGYPICFTVVIWKGFEISHHSSASFGCETGNRISDVHFFVTLLAMAIRDQKADTVLRVLNAAEALVRKTGDTDFSMLTLASKAKVSPATPYNLFGSKGSILYTLLNRSLMKYQKGLNKLSHAPTRTSGC